MSERRTCELLLKWRSTVRYEDKASEDNEIIDLSTELAERYPRNGFPKLYALMRSTGCPRNHKRVWRVYCQMKLSIRRRLKKRYRPAAPESLVQPSWPDKTWSMDCMSDTSSDGRTYRARIVLCGYNRNTLCIEVDMSLTSERVARTLEAVVHTIDLPERIQTDHALRFIISVPFNWCESQGIEPEFTQPGKPTETASIERSNGTYHCDVLDTRLFFLPDQSPKETQQWFTECDCNNLYESRDEISPIELLCDRGFAGFPLMHGLKRRERTEGGKRVRGIEIRPFGRIFSIDMKCRHG